MLKDEIEKVLENFQTEVINNIADREEIRPNEVPLDIKRNFYAIRILELVEKCVPEMEECFCSKKNVTVGEWRCRNCIRNNLIAEIKGRIG